MLFTKVEVYRGIWGTLVMMGHVAMSLLDLFSATAVADAPIQHHVVILVVLKTVEVLEVVEGMMLMDPVANDDPRINLAV